MKKTWIAMTALVMALMIVCAGCGGGNEKPAEEEPEATELPSVTAPPEGEGEGTNILGANANDTSIAALGMDRETWLASLGEDQRKVEEELLGATVDELYKAIGKPKNAVYGTSCFIANGEDGVLYYDGFTVGTTRYPNGMEIVMGTSN